ncbi:chromatin remodelling complex Rsc7/Swp82 subunit-domain-containing protein [Fennellomyces sp. T-0311]|nr:chromatin remodelling complex Rsc7/Swp82 subunit-domain-containing protein [Fennellomyces sp. T-0311]
MPGRDTTAGRRRRGRPPRRRPVGRAAEDGSPAPSDRAQDDNSVEDSVRDNASESEQEEELPRMRTRKRGRPPKRSVTPSDESFDSKRRREEQTPQRSEDAESDIDEAGETKIDKQGRLLGGREYKVPTFTLPMRGDQVFMFAMEPARLLNYRDSYLFFHKNPHLERARLTEEERNWLVDQRLLVHWFRNRDVAVVSARSCFKCFGSRIIKKGKRVRDDYFEARAREMGYTEEQTEDDSETEGGKMGRRALISRTSKSGGYDATTPINNATWMHHAALAVRGFNAQLHERRAEKSVFYDIHTNVNQIAAATQPTRCQFECIDSSKDEFTLDEIQFEDASTHVFRGVGRDLLDGTYDTDAALDTIPEESRPAAQSLLAAAPSFTQILDSEDDERYPIAVLDGQYQAAFPIHFTRFNQPNPKIAPPSVIAATAQSIVAQQHYFGQMYQAMNSISTFAEQVPPQMQQQTPPQMPKQTIPAQQVPANLSPRPPGMPTEQHVCGYQLTKGQVCKRPVMFPGEKCQMHATYTFTTKATPGAVAPQAVAPAAAATSQAPPQAPSLAENKCADCHYLSAPSETLPKEYPCDAFTMIKCAKCVRKYHPTCAHLKTPRQIAAVESYPWACPECKVCCVCKSAGDESTLMICDDCDRGWHTGCCNPKVEKVPEGAWLCPLCADCNGCDEQGDKKEYFHAMAPPTDRIKYPVYLATYCSSCIDNFDHDRFCPVCLRTFSEEDENDDEENEMVACDQCDHWIHTGCDETLTPEKYQSLCDDEEAKYTCPLCADSVKAIHQTAAASNALKGLAQPSGYCVGLVGGKIRTRGVVRYKDHKVAVPEIKGTGIAEMPSL